MPAYLQCEFLRFKEGLLSSFIQFYIVSVRRNFQKKIAEK